ncbi:MAG: S-Ena type endospore appendage [Bacillota bacterium]|nr:S-Ena type endospore appendage [Bacillota bacterium]
MIKEEICGVFNIDPLKNPYAPVWEAEDSIELVFGTLSVYYESGFCEEVEVFVNCEKDKGIFVPLGNTRTRTYASLRKVAIEIRDRKRESGSVQYNSPKNKDTSCRGRFCLTIYYKVKKPKRC